MHVDTSSHKLKVDQKILQDSEIDCISRMNKWNELIFCMLVQIQKSYFNDFWVDMIRNNRGHLVHDTLKSAASKE